MAKFVVVTDACADLPPQIQKQENVPVVSLNIHAGTETFKSAKLTNRAFYDRLKQKQVMKTSQPNETEVAEIVEPILKAGNDVLAVIISSVLSGTYNSFRLAKEMLDKKYPERKFLLVDSQQVSLGITYLTLKAIEWSKAGKSIEDTKKYVESLVPKLNAYALLEEVETLKRGGRLSATKAFLAGLLNVKPILAITNEGYLKGTEIKARGKAMGHTKLLEVVKERIADESIIYIAHSDAPADAQEIATKVKAMFPKNKQVLVGELGPVIASHAGLGAIGIFFIGREKPAIK